MPALVCGVCLAAILGLVAALATIGAHEARAAPIVGFAAAVILMLCTLYVIASRAMGSGWFSDQSNRIVWHQKNTIRVGDSDDANSAPLAQQIAFATSAPAAVVNVPNDWRTALAHHKGDVGHAGGVTTVPAAAATY